MIAKEILKYPIGVLVKYPPGKQNMNPPWEKENHRLKSDFWMEYVNSQEGKWLKFGSVFFLSGMFMAGQPTPPPPAQSTPAEK